MDCNVLNPFLHRVCLVRSKVSAIQIARKIACCLFDGEEDRSAEQRGPRMSLSSYRDGRWPARWECVKSHTAQFEWPKIIFVFEELIFSFNIPNFKEIYRSFNVNECITSVLELIVKPVCHCLSSREFIAKSLQHIKFIYWSVTNVGLKRLSKKKRCFSCCCFIFGKSHACKFKFWLNPIFTDLLSCDDFCSQLNWLLYVTFRSQKSPGNRHATWGIG